MYKNILLATDGSDLAAKAIKHGLSLAAQIGASATIVTIAKPLHTIAPPEVMIAFPKADYDKGAKERAGEILAKVESAARAASVNCQTRFMMHEEPWQAIIDAAQEAESDLIVMGSHGRTGLTRLMLGSEAQKVLTHTTLPVLIVR